MGIVNLELILWDTMYDVLICLFWSQILFKYFISGKDIEQFQDEDKDTYLM